MADVTIFGCGDIGKRVGRLCRERGQKVSGVVRTRRSAREIGDWGITAIFLDLDTATRADIPDCKGDDLYYFIPPPGDNNGDTRSELVIDALESGCPGRVVLISTTGVYGDCAGEWVDESRPVAPSTARRRRVHAEQIWMKWCGEKGVPLTILRVPGIYSRARLPAGRLEAGTPVVDPAESGWTNRIHADDLAAVCMRAMERAAKLKIFNVSDGKPGKIAEYLMAAAHELALATPPVISMSEAQSLLSENMLSYLSESRRIDNSRMLRELDIVIQYPDFLEGLKH